MTQLYTKLQYRVSVTNGAGLVPHDGTKSFKLNGSRLEVLVALAGLYCCQYVRQLHNHQRHHQTDTTTTKISKAEVGGKLVRECLHQSTDGHMHMHRRRENPQAYCLWAHPLDDRGIKTHISIALQGSNFRGGSSLRLYRTANLLFCTIN